jgi:uncharacterized membrane protein YkvA (DUF1232 family)
VGNLDSERNAGLHDTPAAASAAPSSVRAGRPSLSGLVRSWKRWAHRLKLEVVAIYLAYRDPRVPWYARIFAALVLAYAFSPIDLIPDPIPVLGYLDDLLLIPLGVALALKMIPADVMAECRERAQQGESQPKAANWIAATAIVTLWVLLAALAIALVARAIRR